MGALVRQLGALLRELDLAEIEVTVGGVRVRLQRPGGPPAAAAVAAVAAPPPVADVMAPATITIEAPMVGTFYRASSPAAEPYVREGDGVKEGQIVCIIEAMKLMNEIESRTSGRIVKILVDNAQPVEYGPPLVLVEPAG
ncbi:MAG: acetyl-CoA carboxylase biotin carboxyl carrier protein [Candidatus Rokubacteria bacterium]|nr:acetyl-CoA carboxylase biotin carboxyl carrier protein [Candidatus Rokubacteria bacterium]